MIQPNFSPAAIRSLLSTMLAGLTEGTDEMWWTLIGPVETLPTAADHYCDWRISPAGTKQEIATIEHAAAMVQAEHPYLART